MTNNTALTIISLAMMLAFVVPFGIFLLIGEYLLHCGLPVLRSMHHNALHTG